MFWTIRLQTRLRTTYPVSRDDWGYRGLTQDTRCWGERLSSWLMETGDNCWILNNHCSTMYPQNEPNHDQMSQIMENAPLYQSTKIKKWDPPLAFRSQHLECQGAGQGRGHIRTITQTDVANKSFHVWLREYFWREIRGVYYDLNTLS